MFTWTLSRSSSSGKRSRSQGEDVAKIVGATSSKGFYSSYWLIVSCVTANIRSWSLGDGVF